VELSQLGQEFTVFSDHGATPSSARRINSGLPKAVASSRLSGAASSGHKYAVGPSRQPCRSSDPFNISATSTVSGTAVAGRMPWPMACCPWSRHPTGHVVGVLGCLVALVVHALYASLCGVIVDGTPRPGTPGAAAAGSGAVPCEGHQPSVQPGPGAMC